MESILTTVCGEAKRVVDEDSFEGLAEEHGSWHHEQADDNTRALLRGEGVEKTECKVAVHLIDPSIPQARLDSEALAQPATWVQASTDQGGRTLSAVTRPDPFTLEAARTRSNVRSTISPASAATTAQDVLEQQSLQHLQPNMPPPASAPRRQGFSSLYIPLLLRNGGALKEHAAPGVVTDAEGKDEERVVGVMALSRDASLPFTAVEELQLEKFCELATLTLAQHFRHAQAQQEASKASMLQEAVVEVAGTGRVPAIVHRCAQAANALLGTSLTRVLLLSSDGSTATAYTQHAGIREPPPRPKQAPLEQSLHTVIGNKQALVVADVLQDARFIAYAKMLHPPRTGKASQPQLAVPHAPVPPSCAPPENVRKGGDVDLAHMGPAERRVMSARIAPATPSSLSAASSLGREAAAHVHASSNESAPGTASYTAAQDDTRSASRGMVMRDHVRGSRSAGGVLGQSKPRVNLVCMPLLDTKAGAGEPPVRGVVQVLHKRAGAFTDGDLTALRQLCAVLARSLGHALKRQAVIEAQAPDLKLLVSSDLDSCICAALQHLRQATGAAIGCCYVPVSVLSPDDPTLARLDLSRPPTLTGHHWRHPALLDSQEWVAKGGQSAQAEHCLSAQQVEGDVDAQGQPYKFGLARACKTRRSVRVIHETAEKAHLQQSMAAAWGYWKAVQSSLFYPLLNPEQPKQVMGVVHLANKADALRRGFDDVDIAKMHAAASKLSHAMLALSRLREADKRQQGTKALSEMCSALITAPDLEHVCRNIAELGPRAFRAAAVRCFLTSDVRRVDDLPSEPPGASASGGDDATSDVPAQDGRSGSTRGAVKGAASFQLWTSIGPSLRQASGTASSPRASPSQHTPAAALPQGSSPSLDNRNISILMPGALNLRKASRACLHACRLSAVASYV